MQKKKHISQRQHYGVPDCAHQLIKFFTSSLHMQDTIYTRNAKRNTEQWVEFVVRFYAFDKTIDQKRNTYNMLKKLQPKVHNMMKCAFQFEELLHKNKSDKMVEKEKRLQHNWSQLYNNMSQTVAKQKGRRRAKCTKKKTSQ